MKFEDMKGMVLNAVKVSESEIAFLEEAGRVFCLRHEQHCCEEVWVEDICGDLLDIVGSEIVECSESTEDHPAGGWTFYKISTIKGSVTIRWNGESEFYSISVDFYEVELQPSHKSAVKVDRSCLNCGYANWVTNQGEGFCLWGRDIESPQFCSGRNSRIHKKNPFIDCAAWKEAVDVSD